jgi:hypothetical protein
MQQKCSEGSCRKRLITTVSKYIAECHGPRLLVSVPAGPAGRLPHISIAPAPNPRRRGHFDHVLGSASAEIPPCGDAGVAAVPAYH